MARTRKNTKNSIEGDDRDLSLLLVMAFRYAHTRHINMSLLNISEILTDNFHLLSNDFLRQFVRDIVYQYRYYNVCSNKNNVPNPSYLDNFLQQCLKELEKRQDPYLDYEYDSLDRCPDKRGIL